MEGRYCSCVASRHWQVSHQLTSSVLSYSVEHSRIHRCLRQRLTSPRQPLKWYIKDSLSNRWIRQRLSAAGSRFRVVFSIKKGRFSGRKTTLVLALWEILPDTSATPWSEATRKVSDSMAWEIEDVIGLPAFFLLTYLRYRRYRGYKGQVIFYTKILAFHSEMFKHIKKLIFYTANLLFHFC